MAKIVAFAAVLAACLAIAASQSTTAKAAVPTTAAGTTVGVKVTAAATTAGPTTARPTTVAAAAASITTAAAAGNVTTAPVKSLAGPVPAASRTEVQIGKGCDPSGADQAKSKCGVNAHCEKVSSFCKLGVCVCNDGYTSYPNNPNVNTWDCFQSLKIGSPCNPGNITEVFFMPQGAVCNSTTKTVNCGDPMSYNDGECSALKQSIIAVKGYNEKCDNKTQSCNPAYKHSCLWSSAKNDTVCQCSNEYDTTRGICSTVGITEYCDNDRQCNLQFGGAKSTAAQCGSKSDFLFTRCACNATANYTTVMYQNYDKGVQSKAFISCVNSPMARATKEGAKCSVGTTMVNGQPFCSEDFGCQHCPEFEGVLNGYCVGGASQLIASGLLLLVVLLASLLC